MKKLFIAQKNFVPKLIRYLNPLKDIVIMFIRLQQKSPISRKVKSISQSRDFSIDNSLSNVKLNVFDDTNSTNFCNQIATDEMNIAPNEFLNEQ